MSRRDPVTDAVEDGTYSELLTPTNVPKARPDPRERSSDEIVNWSEGKLGPDPYGLLDLTGQRGRRGDTR